MPTFAPVQWNGGLEKVPHSLLNIISKMMIDKRVVASLVEQWLEGKDYFLVDVDVEPGERIAVEIDHADGVWIDDCAELSRFLQESLGEEAGDYELEVGSAGIGQPFKVERQYAIHVGKDVEVLTAEGKKVRGRLKSVAEGAFTLAVSEKRAVEGRKRPVAVEVDKTFRMDEVKYTKYLLSFK